MLCPTKTTKTLTLCCAGCHNATYVLSEDSRACIKVCGGLSRDAADPLKSFGPNSHGGCVCTPGYKLAATGLDKRCELLCGAAVQGPVVTTSFWNSTLGACGEGQCLGHAPACVTLRPCSQQALCVSETIICIACACQCTPGQANPTSRMHNSVCWVVCRMCSWLSPAVRQLDCLRDRAPRATKVCSARLAGRGGQRLQ